MENQSPFLTMQKAETLLKGLLRTVDTELLDANEKKALAALRRLGHETRLDIRDYELSETREEQLKKAVLAKKGLDKLKTNLLVVSHIFGPADIAQLDALFDLTKGRVL
jgi:hypothetical protein